MLKANMKILVVDDMSTMRKIIKKSLTQFGFTNVSEADDGAPAWALLQEASKTAEPFEFVISDWNMPGMTGIDLLKNVRANETTKKLPFLMVTAEAEQANVIAAVKAGVSNYIVKPFTPDALKAKIEKIFNTAAK
ncbi:MAG: response regulator [Bacteriovoracaceae bacterium]